MSDLSMYNIYRDFKKRVSIGDLKDVVSVLCGSSRKAFSRPAKDTWKSVGVCIVLPWGSCGSPEGSWKINREPLIPSYVL